MARANLRVREDLSAAFIQAQDTDQAIRFLQAQVEGENIGLVKQGKVAGSAAEDFQSQVVPLLNDTDSTFILFSLDTSSGDHKSWVLFTFVPEMTAVRNKMLYSSSRDDLKKSLGVGFFVGEYCSNDPREVSYDALEKAMSKDIQDAPLTDLEKLKLEEKAMEKDTNIRSTAMGVVPFPLDDDLTAELRRLHGGPPGEGEGASPTGWVELVIDLQAERVTLGRTSLSPLLAQDIPTESARFFATKAAHSSGGVCLVYSCPEVAPLREKMTYSTIKATVLAEAAALGVVFSKVVEVREAGDLEQALEAGAIDGSTGGGGGGGEIKHNLTHAKPARPGKGRARLIKGSSLDAAGP